MSNRLLVLLQLNRKDLLVLLHLQLNGYSGCILLQLLETSLRDTFVGNISLNLCDEDILLSYKM